jgi:ferredoxin
MTDVAHPGPNGISVLPTIHDVRKVWIDQDLCTGDGLCTDIVPPLFGLNDDGLAYVKDEDGELMTDPGGAKSLANVPSGLEEVTIEAAQECPGECIFITDDSGNNLGIEFQL